MSRYLENQKVKDGDCCEIALRDPILVSGNSEPETLKQESVKETSPAPSDSSADSSEEKPSSPNLLQKRSNFKVRSRSDSFCNERTTSRGAFHKGILKLSNSANRLRSLSESCAENYRISQKDESNSGLDEWLKEEEFEEEDESDSCKVKKTVRFSETIHRQLFRSNSSILGQRKKNQRKQRNKKRHDSHTLSSSAESESAVYIAQISNATDQLSLSDSGIEVEDSDPSEGSPPTAQLPTKSKKKKGKSKKGKKKSSEPSSDLMFDIEL